MEIIFVFFFFFKQKTAYEITRRDWSSDVCSSDLTCVMPAMSTTPAYRMRNAATSVRRRTRVRVMGSLYAGQRLRDPSHEFRGMRAVQPPGHDHRAVVGIDPDGVAARAEHEPARA